MRKDVRLGLAFVSCALGLLGEAACSDPSGGARASRLATGAAAIQGGAVDTGDPAVGFVWYDWGADGYGFCTATLVTPTVVVTAAHCMDGPIEAFYTGTGQPTDLGPKPVSGMVRHAVKASVRHPAYDWMGGCPNKTPDVGLVELEAPLDGVTPIPLATASDLPATGTKCTVVGYGDYTNAGTDSYEQKRSGTVATVDHTASSIQVTFVTAVADSGDSGGPLFCDGKLVGATTCHSDGDFPDHRNEHYARVDAVRDWIDMQIAAWGAK
jgi:secreted trypsin-like serine protease